MRTGTLIRNETEADAPAISDITVAAFSTLPISDHTEQFIIARLRAARALTVSLVADPHDRSMSRALGEGAAGFDNRYA